MRTTGRGGSLIEWFSFHEKISGKRQCHRRLCVTMARTESFDSVSMAGTSSKLPPPVGEICETKDHRPRPSPTHNSRSIRREESPRNVDINTFDGMWQPEMAYKSPVKGLLSESFARIFCRLGHAASYRLPVRQQWHRRRLERKNPVQLRLPLPNGLAGLDNAPAACRHTTAAPLSRPAPALGYA